MSQNSQENLYAGVSSLIKMQTSVNEKETLVVQILSVNFAKLKRITF